VAQNLSPEEVEALVGDEAQTAVETVALRNFRQPRRLSSAQQQSIRAALTHRLPEIEADLSPWLRGDVTVNLIDTGEANANDLFDELHEPLSIVTFTVDGIQGWIIWDNDSALRSVITALGSELPEEIEPRLLSPMEIGLITDAMSLLTEHLAEMLGLEIQVDTYSQTTRAFVAQHDGDPKRDPQRLSIHLELSSMAGTSPVRIYLPGILPERGEEPVESTAQLPEHLGDVPVELSAVLGSIEVALDELTRIEVGDVIPLHLQVGTPIEILVENDRAGTARWGQHNGFLAVAIEHMDPHLSDSTSHE